MTLALTLSPLCASNASNNNVPGEHEFALHKAVSNGHLEKVKSLCNAGADINKIGPKGRTPLHVAIGQGYIKIIKYLCEEGNADLDKVNHNNHTPLLLAAIDVDIAITNNFAIREKIYTLLYLISIGASIDDCVAYYLHTHKNAHRIPNFS